MVVVVVVVPEGITLIYIYTHTHTTGSLNRVPASAGVKAGMSPLPGGR